MKFMAREFRAEYDARIAQLRRVNARKQIKNARSVMPIFEGKLLDVRSTPTLFVNGRRLVGADPHAVQQCIDYELAQLKSAQK